jgi:osmotically-inducible protein OsmY
MIRTVRIAARQTQGRARGMAHRLRPASVPDLDDAELAHKVESVVFRDPAVPKGRISVNAENGRVFLRGEVETPEVISDLETAVRKIAGVRDVKNLLHLPGTPAPHAEGGALLEERREAAHTTTE